MSDFKVNSPAIKQNNVKTAAFLANNNEDDTKLKIKDMPLNQALNVNSAFHGYFKSAEA